MADSAKDVLQGEPGRPSKGDRLSKYPGAKVRAKSSFCYNVHLSTEESLQVNLELAMVKERPSAFQVDEKIHIAVGPGFAASH